MEEYGFNWVEALSDVAKANLLARARIRRFPDSTILYRQGERTDEFFQVLGGSIRKYVVDQTGAEVLLYVYGPGDVVADSAAIDRGPFPVTIETQGDTLLRVWHVDDLDDLRAASPEYDAALARQASQRLRAALLLIQELVTLPVASRVASRLVSLIELNGADAKGSALKLSQADIALMIGATRQTVSGVMKQLKCKGLVDTSYGAITVRDLPGLRSYVGKISMGDKHREIEMHP